MTVCPEDPEHGEMEEKKIYWCEDCRRTFIYDIDLDEWVETK